jgi:hypothetical protein
MVTLPISGARARTGISESGNLMSSRDDDIRNNPEDYYDCPVCGEYHLREEACDEEVGEDE